MRIPIPLILAAVFTAAVTIVIVVSIKYVYSYNPKYVTFNGTTYTVVAPAVTTDFVIGGKLTVVSANVTSITYIDHIGDSSSYSGYTKYHALAASIGQIPSGTGYQLGTAKFYVYNNSGLVLTVFQVYNSATGSAYSAAFVWKVAATAGSEYLFTLASQSDVSGKESTICSIENSLIGSANWIVVVGNWYSCSLGSWSTGWPTRIYTGTLSISPGSTIGGYNLYDFGSFKIIMGYFFMTNAASNIVLTPTT
ncbi:hypothetical protein TTSV1_gp26 [Thermoproteus tenax spherical virus 1]|uniref:Uncharacterized protein n=1 Tax=Thermoproteus tenax spherical virus 1 TaxID=292639 RepID=Q647D6_9VIRU|nr:hypothetical protein TTSV1_gp26 [Thermoproteus tenax spherical virus 1]AAU25976.1 hypothetical protein [Thermoproteus tenax spherical virus 1]